MVFHTIHLLLPKDSPHLEPPDLLLVGELLLVLELQRFAEENGRIEGVAGAHRGC
jgi:hypothetical protein